MNEKIEVLPGCFQHARKMTDKALAEFQEASKLVADYERTVRTELLRRAPSGLAGKLLPALNGLFQHGTASFDLHAEECGGEEARTELLTRLYEAWKDFVDVDIDASAPDRITFHAAEPD